MCERDCSRNSSSVYMLTKINLFFNFDQETDVVCGSDKQTYASLCELDSTACRAQNDLRLAYKGDCGEC